jgi:hypothetical protein
VEKNSQLFKTMPRQVVRNPTAFGDLHRFLFDVLEGTKLKADRYVEAKFGEHMLNKWNVAYSLVAQAQAKAPDTVNVLSGLLFEDTPAHFANTACIQGGCNNEDDVRFLQHLQTSSTHCSGAQLVDFVLAELVAAKRFDLVEPFKPMFQNELAASYSGERLLGSMSSPQSGNRSKLPRTVQLPRVALLHTMDQDSNVASGIFTTNVGFHHRRLQDMTETTDREWQLLLTEVAKAYPPPPAAVLQ